MVRPLVMGILNVTPDSFSDGGRFFDPEVAVAHGLAMVAEGADLVDVGGESTRPGARGVDEAEERRRVIPVIASLATEGVRTSVDTSKPGVAEAAIAAGASLVNDVSASLDVASVIAGAVADGHSVGWVAMHMRGAPATMNGLAVYDDVVAEVRAHLVERAERARDLGIEDVWIDPGIGFAKTPSHNWSLLRHLDVLCSTGWPVLVGTSRKSFLGGDGPHDRFEASLATATLAIAEGARMVRVHDVAATVNAARLMAAPGLPEIEAVA